MNKSVCSVLEEDLWELLDTTHTGRMNGTLGSHVEGCEICQAKLKHIRRLHLHLERRRPCTAFACHDRSVPDPSPHR